MMAKRPTVKRSAMFFNQFSFVLSAIFGIGLLTLIMWQARSLPIWLRIGGPLNALIAALVFWLALRPTPSLGVNTTVNTAADFDRLLGSGKPTVLEFYSEY
jgi:hypothetical protein